MHTLWLVLLRGCLAAWISSYFLGAAHAQHAPRLTDQGRWLLGGSVGGHWSNNARSPTLTRYPTATMVAAPSLLYFVRDAVGIGGYVGYGYRRVPYLAFETSTHSLSLGLQGALELVLGDRVGILLQPSLGYRRSWIRLSEPTIGFFGGGGRTQQQRSPLVSPNLSGVRDCVEAGLFAPLVFHLNDSLGIGLGPYLSYELYLRPRDLYGDRYHHVVVGVGTWIGGTVSSTSEASSPMSPAPAMQRLSARGRHIIDGALGGYWSNDRQHGLLDRTPQYGVLVQPSWLYFLRDGIGLGGYARYAVSRRSTGRDGATESQARPSSDNAFPIEPARNAPLDHDVAVGVTSAFVLMESGPVSLFARPYVGVSVVVREVQVFSFDWSRPVGSPFDADVERQTDVRAQAGLTLPVVVQLSSAIGVGLGPDLLWEHVSGYYSLRAGVSSWIARSF